MSERSPSMKVKPVVSSASSSVDTGRAILSASAPNIGAKPSQEAILFTEKGPSVSMEPSVLSSLGER